MTFQCPFCHKSEFAVWRVCFKGISNRDLPLECPRCGKLSTLDGKSATISNVLTITATFGSIFGLSSYFDYASNSEPTVLALSLLLTGVVRYFSIKQFGVLTGYKSKRWGGPAETRESLLLSDVGTELKRLKDNKKAKFTVLYEPKDNRYMSLYCRKGMFVIELAFLPEEVEEKFGEKFKHALTNVSTNPREFDTNGVRGLEADLGTNLEEASDKIQKVFVDVFGFKPEAKVLIDRD